MLDGEAYINLLNVPQGCSTEKSRVTVGLG